MNSRNLLNEILHKIGNAVCNFFNFITYLLEISFTLIKIQGIEKEKALSVLLIIDKKDKISHEHFIDELLKIGLLREQLDEVVNILQVIYILYILKIPLFNYSCYLKR